MAEFQTELENCDPGKCTMLKCTIGPLEKGKSVVFKVRSRLFTETQIKVGVVLKIMISTFLSVAKEEHIFILYYFVVVANRQ